MDKKKVLVLGGSGYLGRHVVEELNDHKVDVLCLENKHVVPVQKSLIRVLNGNLVDFHWESLEGENLQVIVHAARFSGRNKQSRRLAALENAKANERLIRWLMTLQAPPLLLFVSGSLVYGSHNDLLIDENHPPEPTSFQREYFLAEEPILEALEKNELPVQIVRPSWIYGRGSWLEAFYLLPARRKKFLPIYGNGENNMSFIHVEDCARKIVHLAERGEAGKVYNLFTQTSTQKKFVRILCDLMDVQARSIPLWWVQLRFEKAVKEAFSFSLNMHTMHQHAFQDFQPRYPDLKVGLSHVIRGF